ncbi:MAG: thioredoxin-disulfide reductase [bacterium]
MGQRDFDIIIVGAGPAGLTAGLYAGRSKLNVVCYEKLAPGGEILNTEYVEDYPGFELIGGPELAQKFADHAVKFGLKIEMEEVSEIRKDGEDFLVTTDMGERRCGAVIYTAGGYPRKLGISGEEAYAGKGVSYCALCDGAFFQDEVITVVGGGNSAVEEAQFLTKYGSKVYLIHRRKGFRAHAVLLDRLSANEKVEMILDCVVEEVVGDEKEMKKLRLRNTKTGEESELEASGLFVFIGFIPNTDPIKDPVEFDEGGFIVTDQNMATGVPGLFVAGDVRSQLIRQITNASGDATTAAVAAEKYLEAQEMAKNQKGEAAAAAS